MELAYARSLAESIVAKLAPCCDKICICGGIRRHKTDPHDVDIVALPMRDEEKDMYGNVTGSHVIPAFINIVNLWTKIKGEPTGKYTQRLLKDGRHLEISIAQPDNYGCLQLIRTGDEDFTHMCMVHAIRMGLRQSEGYLWDEDKKLNVPTEEDYFRLLNLPYVVPEKRDKNAFR